MYYYLGAPPPSEGKKEGQRKVPDTFYLVTKMFYLEAELPSKKFFESC